MFEHFIAALQALGPTMTGLDTALLFLILRVVYLNHKDLDCVKHEFSHFQVVIQEVNKTIDSTEEYTKDTYRLIRDTPLTHLYYKDGQILKAY